MPLCAPQYPLCSIYLSLPLLDPSIPSGTVPVWSSPHALCMEHHRPETLSLRFQKSPPWGGSYALGPLPSSRGEIRACVLLHAECQQLSLWNPREQQGVQSHSVKPLTVPGQAQPPLAGPPAATSAVPKGSEKGEGGPCSSSHPDCFRALPLGLGVVSEAKWGGRRSSRSPVSLRRTFLRRKALNLLGSH